MPELLDETERASFREALDKLLSERYTDDEWFAMSDDEHDEAVYQAAIEIEDRED